jgi:hypothetical protein
MEAERVVIASKNIKVALSGRFRYLLTTSLGKITQIQPASSLVDNI